MKELSIVEKWYFFCCVLFAWMPVIALWGNNLQEVGSLEILLWGLILFCIVTLMYACLSLLKISSIKKILFIYIFLLMFVSVEHFFDADAYLFNFLWCYFHLNYYILLPCWFLFFAFIIYRISISKLNIKPAVNWISMSVLILFVLQVLSIGIKSSGVVHYSFHKDMPQSAIETYPDIYYIILDAYSRSDVLKNIYGYDNNQWDLFLKNKGFFIAHSYSNYGNTKQSLFSSLSMKYLDRDEGDLSISNMISMSDLYGVLRNHGYEVINIASGSGMTNEIDAASVNLNKPLFSYFSISLLNKTVLGPFIRKFGLSNYLHFCNIENSLKTLKKIGLQGRGRLPKFVLCHILCPHVPFVLNEYAKYSFFERMNSFDEISNLYSRQIAGLNLRMKEIIDILLKEKSVPPVIIIQGDHGNNFVPRIDSSLLEAKYRFANLNAYFLPQIGKKACAVYADITPVNTFRLILNYYLGCEFPLLPDKVVFDTSERFTVKQLNDIEMVSILPLLKKNVQHYLGLVQKKNQKFIEG